MRPFYERASPRQLQWLIWIFTVIIIFVSSAWQEGAAEAGTYAILNTLFYAGIVYLNILVLFPRLYQAGKRGLYFGAVGAMIAVFSAARALSFWWVFYRYFEPVPKPFSMMILVGSILSCLFIYIMSLVFRIAIAYFSLKKQAEEIMLLKSRAELNLLKSQVQPHFLFNTLNNIYYESYRESPRTALLIERLSEIMRYFVDESPRQYVQLATEIRFLENYMALEQIRIRYGVHIRFTKECDVEWKVPPMLLMTFVENIFKHGIDKTSPNNSVDISIRCDGSYLHFRTRNSLHNPAAPSAGTGFGIKNLRDRLQLLYGDDFELSTNAEADYYSAFLKFPLS